MAAIAFGGSSAASFTNDCRGSLFTRQRGRRVILVVLHRQGRTDALGDERSDNDDALAPGCHRPHGVTRTDGVGWLGP
jgi:hypothetical protein